MDLREIRPCHGSGGYLQASHRGGGFATGSVHVEVVVGEVTLRQVFSLSSSAVPRQYHSTGAPY
jgi:hypothetical protein